MISGLKKNSNSAAEGHRNSENHTTARRNRESAPQSSLLGRFWEASRRPGGTETPKKKKTKNKNKKRFAMRNRCLSERGILGVKSMSAAEEWSSISEEYPSTSLRFLHTYQRSLAESAAGSTTPAATTGRAYRCIYRLTIQLQIQFQMHKQIQTQIQTQLGYVYRYIYTYTNTYTETATDTDADATTTAADIDTDADRIRRGVA